MLASAGLIAVAALTTGCKSSSQSAATGTKAPVAATNTASAPVAGATSAADATPPAGTGTVPDVCSTLSTSTVAGILGHPVTAASSQGIAGQSFCDYSDGAAGYPVRVELDNVNAGSMYQAYKSVSGKPTDLAAIGDQAFGDATGIHVLSGSYYIEVNGPAGAVLSGDYTKPTAIAKALIAALT